MQAPLSPAGLAAQELTEHYWDLAGEPIGKGQSLALKATCSPPAYSEQEQGFGGRLHCPVGLWACCLELGFVFQTP